MPGLKNRQEENLARVGPGTPSGAVFRRYWLPVEVSANLGGGRRRTFFGLGGASPHARNPIRVKALGEELVLFRDASGQPVLLGEHCSHRGTSLVYGRIEDDCIRCLYHGWAYDRAGRVVDMPAEPPTSRFKNTIRHPAYPCVEVGGLIFAYLGPPDTQPLFPRYDVLYREDGVRVVGDGGYVEPCNVFQAMHDNNLDTWHVDIQHVWFNKEEPPFRHMHHGKDGHPPTPIKYERTPWGTRDVVLKDAETPGQYEYYELHTVWPSARVNFPGGTSMKWALPLDDYHTRWFVVEVYPFDEHGRVTPAAERIMNAPGPNMIRGADKLPPGWYDQVGGWWDFGHPWRQGVFWEDHVAQVSQNVGERQLPDWESWHLGSSDKGLVLNRRVWREQVRRVQEGLDPVGVLRDPADDQPIHVPSDNLYVDWDAGMRLFSMSVEERLQALASGAAPGAGPHGLHGRQNGATAPPPAGDSATNPPAARNGAAKRRGARTNGKTSPTHGKAPRARREVAR
ncbi:MAG TPA: Rieske 2Fe-2S domain-containing protein [Chloroflexota bacterium]|jgi:phenylpropionate dioxygenase-like ring-hydroxylating dioxygenase large terminal subunit